MKNKTWLTQLATLEQENHIEKHEEGQMQNFVSLAKVEGVHQNDCRCVGKLWKDIQIWKPGKAMCLQNFLQRQTF